MDYDKARSLLKKYWEGETSLEDERLLKAFFSQPGEPPDDLKTAKDLFDYFRDEEKAPAPQEDLTQKLRKQWNNRKETPGKKAPLWRRLTTYAAVLVLLLVPGYFFISRNRNEQLITVQTETFDDPKKAVDETEKALLLLSRNMNDGMAKMKTFELFDEIKHSEKFKGQKKLSKK